MKKTLCIILLTFSNFLVYSQNIENVAFEVKENKIVVNFDLTNCPEREKYDIALIFIDEKNKKIVPKTITGDFVRISCGKKKEIIWDVLSDNDLVTGNLKAIVEISKKYKMKIVGGPGNAFLSVLLPGLGDKYINMNSKDKHIDWLNTLLVYGPIGYGYKNYKDDRENASISIGIGVGFWLFDIFWVASKGFQNKKEQLGLAKKTNKNLFMITCDNKNLQLRYTIKF